MCTTLVIVMLSFTNTFLLEFDVLGKGIGEVLMSVGNLLAFTSKHLYESNLVKSTYEKEMMDILDIVKIFDDI
jgi:hypothetical protein